MGQVTQIAILIAFVQTIAFAQGPGPIIAPGPINLDFERGEPGTIPEGWTLPPSASKASDLGECTSDRPQHGRHCAVLYSAHPVASTAYGKLGQTIDARPFRRKLIRFSAAVRTEVHQTGSWAGLSLRVDRSGNHGFVDDMF